MLGVWKARIKQGGDNPSLVIWKSDVGKLKRILFFDNPGSCLGQ